MVQHAKYELLCFLMGSVCKLLVKWKKFGIEFLWYGMLCSYKLFFNGWLLRYKYQIYIEYLFPELFHLLLLKTISFTMQASKLGYKTSNFKSNLLQLFWCHGVKIMTPMPKIGLTWIALNTISHACAKPINTKTIFCRLRVAMVKHVFWTHKKPFSFPHWTKWNSCLKGQCYYNQNRYIWIQLVLTCNFELAMGMANELFNLWKKYDFHTFKFHLIL